MKQLIHLTAAEQDRLEHEAERRGCSLSDLIQLLVSKSTPRPPYRLPGQKSNGWSRITCEFIASAPADIPRTRAVAPAYRPDGPKPRGPRPATP